MPTKFSPISLLPLLPLISLSAVAQTTIPDGTTRYEANTPGAYLLEEGTTRSVTSGANESIRIANAGTAGTYELTIDGSVLQSDTGRGIRTGTANVTYTLNVGETGLVQARSDDAIQARAGTFSLTNSGTIYSGPTLGSSPTSPIATGQALDLTSAIGGNVVNEASGILRADGHDAVRLGSNMTFTNHGTVLGNSVVNDSSANNALNASGNTSVAENYSTSEGVSFEDGANSSLDNYGSISGSRHGVESGELATNVTITNRSTGTIVGRNGSGIGFDATSASASNVVIHNHGVVRGDYAGVGNVIDRTGQASTTQDGDGDGIDIDGAVTINNHATGQILSTGAGGFDTSGRANNSEAVAIGGGMIVNDGLIRGAGRGILVNNDTHVDRSGVSATTITNNAGGTIEGQNGFAIRLENKTGTAIDNDTITNAGTIIGGGTIPDPDAVVTLQNGGVDTNSTGTLDGVAYTGTGSARFIRGDGSAIQMGEGDDVLTNTGTITGSTGRAVNMEGGADTVNYNAGTITGDIDGGAGVDMLNLGVGVTNGSAIKRIERINVGGGTATLSGVVSGGSLVKGGAGKLVLTAANETTGLITVEQGTLVVNNTTGSGTGSGNVLVDTGAMLGGDGFIAGDLAISGILAPGNSIGTLEVGGSVTWNGGAENAWQFELGLGDVSDRLLIAGDFLKGSGEEFVFDFLSGTTTGEFVLVEWDGTTDFTAGDFSHVNLAEGLEGAFSVEGNQLVFTAVPEPSTYAALFGAGALGFALLRRRRASS